jgi:hypothetical protein
MGKKFEYTWAESEPKNFDTITPYIKAEPFVYDNTKQYAQIDLANKDIVNTTKLSKGSTTYKMRYVPFSEYAGTVRARWEKSESDGWHAQYQWASFWYSNGEGSWG